MPYKPLKRLQTICKLGGSDIGPFDARDATQPQRSCPVSAISLQDGHRMGFGPIRTAKPSGDIHECWIHSTQSHVPCLWTHHANQYLHTDCDGKKSLKQNQEKKAKCANKNTTEKKSKMVCQWKSHKKVKCSALLKASWRKKITEALNLCKL